MWGIVHGARPYVQRHMAGRCEKFAMWLYAAWMYTTWTVVVHGRRKGARIGHMRNSTTATERRQFPANVGRVATCDAAGRVGCCSQNYFISASDWAPNTNNNNLLIEFENHYQLCDASVKIIESLWPNEPNAAVVWWTERTQIWIQICHNPGNKWTVYLLQTANTNTNTRRYPFCTWFDSVRVWFNWCTYLFLAKHRPNLTLSLTSTQSNISISHQWHYFMINVCFGQYSILTLMERQQWKLLPQINVIPFLCDRISAGDAVSHCMGVCRRCSTPKTNVSSIYMTYLNRLHFYATKSAKLVKLNYESLSLVGSSDVWSRFFDVFFPLFIS